MELKTRIEEFEKRHGGLRPAARVLQIDPGYLCKLKSGSKNPSKKILKKLGLRKVIIYEDTLQSKDEQ